MAGIERSGSLQEFVYERPATVEEAVAALAAGDALALAGGTDLIPQLREGPEDRTRESFGEGDGEGFE